MKIKMVLIFLIIANLLLSSTAVGSAFSIPDRIYIRSDGTVSPQSPLISRAGNVYTLTGDLTCEVVVECNNIVIDGRGHSLQRSDDSIAINSVGLNLTCSNVTVQNLKIANWDAGILGVFNNNTIKNSWISDCGSGFKIYAQYYVITGNDVENNNEAIRVGIGGLHFIASNNFVNNKVCFALYDSGNVIVQNNIINCSEAAFRLDNEGWTQTVYHNNFVGNAKSIIDYTYSNSIERPVQSEVQPWDNGASGNYWSDYTGVDRNRDGIGDSAEKISTYYRSEVLSFYSIEDRYPLISPYDLNTAIPPIPQALIPQLGTQSIPDNQAKALSFLKDVLGLDLTKYVPTLESNHVGIDESTVSQNLAYTLKENSKDYASVRMVFTNRSLTLCDLFLHYGSTWPSQDPYETAKAIMQNYQAWTGDPDVNTMVNQLIAAGSAKNTTTLSGNISFKMRADSPQTTCHWTYNYGGVDYSGVTLKIENYSQTYNPISFSDDRATTKIGDTNIGISKSNAIAIAEQYVKNNFTYPQSYGNGTVIFVNGLNVANQSTTATLTTTSRYDSALYPCWNLHVVLDHKYSGNVVAVNVRVWAGDGAVFSARTEADFDWGNGFVPPIFLGGWFMFFMLVLFAVAWAVVLVVVLVIVLKETEKRQPDKTVS